MKMALVLNVDDPQIYLCICQEGGTDFSLAKDEMASS